MSSPAPLSPLHALAFGLVPAALAAPAPLAASATSASASITTPAEGPFERALHRRDAGWLPEAWMRKTAPEAAPEAAPERAPSPADGVEVSTEGLSATGFAAMPKSLQDPAVPIHPALSDRFFFGAGVFYSTSTTEARLDSPSGLGTNVDFEDLLGLDETTWAPQGLARWRMSDRWRLELEYFQVDRSRTRATTEDIDWGDQTFPAGTQVETEFDVAVTRLSCGYSFFKRPDKELGVALGFHVTDIKASLSGSGGNAETGKVLAPLPVLSMYGQVALTDIWALAGRLDWFKLEYDPYRGHIYSLGMDALCQPFRNVGFGLGWRGLEFEVEANKNDWDGQIRSVYSGPIAFLSVSF